MARPYYTPEQRTIAFWNKVAITADDNQCWLWQGCHLLSGYGLMEINRKRIRAHRIAWSYPDYVIPEGMDVCHSCDNPKCCNPKHLFIGTHQENMDDMKMKKRYCMPITRKGIDSNKAKLTEEQVLAIRSEYIPYKVSTPKLAAKYNVHQSVIHDIVTRKTWKHI